jgi:hypothetical protein
MTAKLVELRPAKTTDNVAATLRTIADDIDAGFDWPITTAVLVLSTESERPDGDDHHTVFTDWRTYSMGPRNGIIATRGVLSSALNKLDGRDG